MDIYFQSENGTCAEFMNGKAGKKETISITIAPLKVRQTESEMNLNVSYGCNFWLDCANKGCQYSAAGRSRPRMKKAGD